MHTFNPIIGISGSNKVHKVGTLIAITMLIGGLIWITTALFHRTRGAGVTESASAAITPDKTPKGLTAEQWQGIQEAYDASKRSVRQEGDGWKAENPGQGLTVQFDRRGMEVRPESGGWHWGLELTSYGVGAAQTPIEGQAAGVRTEARRVAYDWDATLEEWYQNDARGLEHGYTIRRRPAGASASDPLALQLKVRGGLRPIGPVEGRNLAFGRDQGSALLRYSNLKVFDAEGKELAAKFEADGEEAFRIVVKDQGASYPVTIDPTISQEAYLKASNAAADDRFGSSVAISGDTVVVGAPNGDAPGGTANVGTAYVYVRNGATWTQQAILTASNADANDEFGGSVAISGDTIVIGAPNESSNNSATPGDNKSALAGAAYVFVRSGTTWSEQGYLKASNAQPGDKFGWSVAISGDTVVVGAVDSQSFEGAAYVFVWTGWWSEQTILKASNAQPGDWFGTSVAISGETVVVGANGEASSATGGPTDDTALEAGAAYVFVRNGTAWSEQTMLKASNAESIDRFGSSVAISGDTVVVGALAEDSNATGVGGNQGNDASGPYWNSGAAYVFVRSGTTWSQQAYLKASNTDGGDNFGATVAIAGDTVVIGARNEDSSATGGQADNSASNAGAAYVFVRNGTAWSQQTILKASNADANDRFGTSAISGDTVLIGTRFEDSSATGGEADNSAPDAGAVYVFPLNTPPTITASGVTRSAGTAGSSSTIATVADAETAAGSLTVTVTSANPSNGVTLSTITNTNGTVTANIVAASGATSATFTLQVSDGTATATATLNVTVSAASPGIGGDITVSSSADKIGPGGVVTITHTLTNSASTPASTTYTSTLPAGLSAVSGGCTPSTGSCIVGPVIAPGGGLSSLRRKAAFNSTLAGQTITWTGTIPGNGSVAIVYKVQVSVQAASGTQYCVSTTIGGSAGPSGCVTVTAPLAGPGAAPEMAAPASLQRPGSVLIYNLYTSGASSSSQDTRIVLTNTNLVNPVSVHLFMVDGSNCSVADFYLTLTQSQTVSILASDLDPGVTGYIIAVATDRDGCPTIHNDLIGGTQVKFESGHRTNLSAFGIAGLVPVDPLCTPGAVTATLAFNGLQYNQLPRTLAIDNLQPPAAGNSTMLVVNRIGGDLAVGAQTLGSIAGLLFDDIETAQSFVLAGGTCQLRGMLGNNFPRTVPRYTSVIPAGRSGWMKFWTVDDQSITGVMINHSTNGFGGGHNLHALTTTAAATLTIPVFPAS